MLDRQVATVNPPTQRRVPAHPKVDGDSWPSRLLAVRTTDAEGPERVYRLRVRCPWLKPSL